MPSTVTLTGPGTATVTDDAAAAITAMSTAVVGAIEAQTLALCGTPGQPGSLFALNNSLAQITGNLGSSADVAKSLSKALSDLDVAITAMSATMAVGNSLQATMVANQIKTNNFQVQATKEALERTGQPVPVEPPIQDQIKENVKDGIVLTETAVVTGAITSQIEASVVATGSMITGTEAYKTVAGWFSKAKDSLLSLLPDSLKTSKSKVSSQTATPT